MSAKKQLHQLVSQFRAQQDAAIAEFEGKIKAILAEVEISKTNANLDLSYQEQRLKKWDIESRERTDDIRMKLQELSHNAEVRLESAKGITDFYKNMVTGIASQVNGIALQNEDIS